MTHDPFSTNDPIVILSSEQQYNDMKAQLARHEAWVAAHAWGGKNGKKWLSYKPESVPMDCRINNRERDAIVVYEWLNNPPALTDKYKGKYFLYVKFERGTAHDGHRYLKTRGTATTFMGALLGNAVLGAYSQWTPGGPSYAITVYGTNGIVYFGRWWPNAGDYCKIRPMKNQERARIDYRGLKPE